MSTTTEDGTPGVEPVLDGEWKRVDVSEVVGFTLLTEDNGSSSRITIPFLSFGKDNTKKI